MSRVPSGRRPATRTRARAASGASVDRLRRTVAVPPGAGLSISAAADRLRTTARMLRYREALGLLSPGRRGGGRRRYAERDLLAAAYAIELERRYDVPPKALAFALRALTEQDVAVDVRWLGTVTGRLAPTAIAALDFEASKARDLLQMPRAQPS